MMTLRPLVMKFGGTSVEDAAAFERVAKIIEARRDGLPVIVVSAMSRITDAFLTNVELAAQGNLEGVNSLDSHLTRYQQVAEVMVPGNESCAFESELTITRCKIVELLHEISFHPDRRPRLQDEVVSYGERLSASLLALVLRAHALPARYVDARRCIVTDSEYGRANPFWKETASRTRGELMSLVEAGEIPVLGGFISSTLDGTTATLGRGGSDYTATLVGAALHASEVQIWTDVSGVLTADPAIVSRPYTIPHLSYKEMAELTFYGLKVLHPKTVQPAAEASIPIRILNSRMPEEAGTYVCSWSVKTPEVVKIITHKSGVTMVHVTSSQTQGFNGFHQAMFDVLHAYKGFISVVAISGTSVSLTLNEPGLLTDLIGQLEQLGEVKIEPKHAQIVAVGEGLRSALGVAARAFSVLADECPFLISQGESGSNLSFLIAEERANEVVRRLHNTFFGEVSKPDENVMLYSRQNTIEIV